jgi:hypothetical protein
MKQSVTNAIKEEHRETILHRHGVIPCLYFGGRLSQIIAHARRTKTVQPAIKGLKGSGD